MNNVLEQNINIELFTANKIYLLKSKIVLGFYSLKNASLVRCITGNIKLCFCNSKKKIFPISNTCCSEIAFFTIYADDCSEDQGILWLSCCQ